jgi:hypothetical protein
MFVCCECCVLSGRVLCDELITRPEESYRLWCVLCVIKKPRGHGGHSPCWAAVPQKIIIIIIIIIIKAANDNLIKSHHSLSNVVCSKVHHC